MAIISFKNARRLIAAAAILGSYAYIDYCLPTYTLVRIDEIGTRRFDADGNYQRKAGESKGPTRDVEMIYTTLAYLEKDPVTGNEVPKVYGHEEKYKLVYVNEDTGFSFPFWLKFDTANLQGAAADLRTQFAYVKSFEWRNELFSWFPNALTIIKWEPGMSVINLLRIIVTTLWAIGVVAVWYWIRRLQRNIAARVEAAAQAAKQRADALGDGIDAVGSRVDAVNNSEGMQTTRRRFWKIFGGWI
jgi:hypothetical protein